MRIYIVALAFTLFSTLAYADNWYTESFWLLHEDHHTGGHAAVGKDADYDQTRSLLRLVQPDVIQIHAKGNPGWTTYPSTIGFTPPRLAKDVLGIWRDVARQDGYHFSVYYNIGRDGEIMQRRPEWNRMLPDGSPVDRALCYHSGVAEAYLWPMIREIMTGYQPKGFWFDGSCFTIRQCYCPKCRARFRQKNEMAAPANSNQPGWSDYHAMQRQIYREFIAQTCREIHQVDPDCLVSFNWAYSVRMPEKPDPGIAYLTGDIGNGVGGLSTEAHWYDSTDVPFDLMTQVNTLQLHDETAKRPVMQTKPSVQLEQEMAIIVANGGRYNAWDSPTSESGLTPARFEYMAKVATPFLRGRQPWCAESRRIPDVSLLHSPAIHYAITDASATSFTKRNNRLDGAAQLLPALHLNYEMLPDWRLAVGDIRSPLVIVEHAKGMARKTADDLLNYARDGGSLLLTGMSVYQDKRFVDSLDCQMVSSPKEPEPLAVSLGAKTFSFDHWLFRMRTTDDKTLLTVAAADGQDYPLVIHNRVGKGRLICVPLPLLTKHGGQAVPVEVIQEIFELVLPRAQRQLSTSAPDSVECVLRGQGEGSSHRRIVHLVNMAAGDREVLKANNRSYTLIRSLPQVPACQITVRLPQEPGSVTLQPQNQPLAQWHYDDGQLAAQVPPFAVHQMVVIENK